MSVVGNPITLGGSSGGGGLEIDTYTFTPASQDAVLSITLTRDAVPLRVEILTSTTGSVKEDFALHETVSAFLCPFPESIPTTTMFRVECNGCFSARNGVSGNMSYGAFTQNFTWTPSWGNYGRYRCMAQTSGYKLTLAKPLSNARWLVGVTYTIKAY